MKLNGRFMNHARNFATVASLIDAVLAHTGPKIVLGIPLGIGKPNPFVNALYRRVQANPELDLTIITALSLQKPHGSSELEKRFLEPFVDRVFGDYPDLDYLIAHRAGNLPPNVRVIEQFFKTGDYLDNGTAQQNFLYVNYTNVVRDLLTQGINVLAQAVAVDEMDAGRLSLSSNPDIFPDMADFLATHPELGILLVACCNHKLPFMENQAVVSRDAFHMVLEDPVCNHDLFAPPNMKVSLQDYAIGLYASSLIRDGGTLQIGIGSLGDAITQSLLLREQNNADYRALIADLFAQPLPAMADLGAFKEGLYGCSEMFVNGFMHLIQAGIIRREVFDHEALQLLLNQKKIHLELLPDTLSVLLAAGVIAPVLRAEDVAFLLHYGLFKPGVVWQTDAQQVAQLKVAEYCIASRLGRSEPSLFRQALIGWHFYAWRVFSRAKGVLSGAA
jgi:acyl-CoA hydrolase